MSGSSLATRLSRRAVLRAGAGLSAAAALGPAATGAAPAKLSGKITVMYAQDPIRAPYMDAAAAAVKAANPGVEIAMRTPGVIGDAYLLSLLLAIRAGNAPDVFLASGVAIGALAAGDAAIPLDPYLKDWPDWSFYPQTVRDSVAYEGKIWCIPFALDTHYLYFRRDIFQRAGLPATWQPANVGGILEAALAVKAKVPDVIPYALYAGQNAGSGMAIASFVPLIFAYGGSYKDANGKWIIDSCAVRDTLTYYADAYQKDKVVPQQVVTTPNVTMVMQEKLGNGQLAILNETSEAYGPWVSADPANKEEIGYLLFPTAQGGPSFSVATPGDCWFVSAKSKYPDLAWEYVKTWNNRQTVAEVCIKEPYPPARTDAQKDVAAQGGFLADLAATLPAARFNPPDPNYQQIITILYDVTGSIATGQESPQSAVQRYSANLERVLGADNVVRQPCS